MKKQHFYLLLLIILCSCNSANNDSSNENTEVQTEEKLSREKAKELIDGEIERTKNDVGGSKKDIKDFTIHDITERNGIFTITYIWSGDMHQPSVPPLEGEKYEGSYAVKNDTAMLRVQQKDNIWQILP